jgi:proteasome lid subunit RPN8/RPN11
MTIRLKHSDFAAIVAYARNGLPNEVCGLIAGKIDNDIKIVEKVYFLSNPDKSPEHFSIDPKEQLAAIKNMREHGFAPLGNFHSHPSTPSRPSPEDIKLAYDPNASYLILSLSDEEKPTLNAFGIKGGEVTPQVVDVIPP